MVFCHMVLVERFLIQLKLNIELLYFFFFFLILNGIALSLRGRQLLWFLSLLFSSSVDNIRISIGLPPGVIVWCELTLVKPSMQVQNSA